MEFCEQYGKKKNVIFSQFYGSTSGREALPSKLLDVRYWAWNQSRPRTNCSEYSVVFFQTWIFMCKYELDSLRKIPMKGPLLRDYTSQVDNWPSETQKSLHFMMHISSTDAVKSNSGTSKVKINIFLSLPARSQQ